MRKNAKKAFACAVAIAMIFGSTIIPMSAKAEAISEGITEEEYDQNPDDYIEMDSYNIYTGETQKYLMKNYSDDTIFPTIKGSQGLDKSTKKINNDADNNPSLKSLITPGLDRRIQINNTNVAPYRYIGQLNSVYKSTSSNKRITKKGSAFLVANNLILTAAHCVHEHGYKLEKLTFYPCQNGISNRPYAYPCNTVHVPSKYKKEPNSQTSTAVKYDYAVVEINAEPGKTLGYFSLGGYKTQHNYTNLKNKQIYVTGYPSDKNGKLYQHSGGLQSFNDENWRMYYYIDTTAGESGCPVYRCIGTNYYVVGIHFRDNSNGMGNSGRYITKNIYELIKKYRK